MVKVFLIFTLWCLTIDAKDVVKKALFMNSDNQLQYGTYDPDRSHKRDKDSYAVQVEKYITPSNFSVDTLAVQKTAIVPEVESLVTTMHLKAGQIVLTKDQKPLLIEAVFANGKVVGQPLEVNLSSRFRLDKINKFFAPIQRVDRAILDKTEIIGVLEQTCSKDKFFCKDQEISEINGVSVCEKLNLCYSTKKTHINGVFSNGALLINNTLFPAGTFSKPQDVEVKGGEVSP
ncbi:hypothetical protein K2X05_13385 [bacterium]|nr:hypothetical protein [bacterium]